MDFLHAAELRTLIAQQGKWSVSLYMPTPWNGIDEQQNAIRLKNLLAEAETKLLANGVRRTRVQQLMHPAENLLWNDDFWHPHSDGLAIFLSNDFHAMYRLPAQFKELLVIANHFHIKPLLPMLDRAGKFYILAISLGNTRLFQANADDMSEIEPHFPTGLQTAMSIDEPERFLNLHPGTVNQSEADGVEVFSGHGDVDQEEKNIRRFFQCINAGLDSLIEDKAVPLVLAGVDHLLSTYREINTYGNVLKDAIIGDPERRNLKVLREQAWNIVKPFFEASQRKAFEKYQQLSGQQSELTTNDLTKIVKAARFGRVETLFVPLGEHAWGRYDDEANQVILVVKPGMEEEDLLDFAAAETILNAGQVFAVPPDQIPGDGDLAAILRYAAPGA